MKVMSNGMYTLYITGLGLFQDLVLVWLLEDYSMEGNCKIGSEYFYFPQMAQIFTRD